jgi:predicted dehydrogenase
MNGIHPLDRRGFLAAGAACLATTPRFVHTAEPPPAKIRVGQIGVGHAHASKLSVYRASADYDVVGIVEPDDELWNRVRTHAAYRDLPRLSQEQMLDTPGLQVVLVETRVRDLLDAAEACVAAGKHIHLDKPAGESLVQFERILASAQQQRLLVQLGYMYRYNPAVSLLKDFLQRGWLGDVFEIHTVMSKVVSASNRRALAEYPGGMMFELGCHILDLVIGVLGEPSEISAFRQHASSHEDTLLDNMLAVLRYPRAIATVKSSAQEVEGFARRHFVVCGSGGTFHIQPLDNPSARVALSEPRGNYSAGYQEVTFPKFTRYVADAADMARIIRGEKASDFPSAHDLAVQRTLLKACELPLDR